MDHQQLVGELIERDTMDAPNGWIQWKGTNVCIDLHCVCGHLGHYDGEFLYFWRCPACDTPYALGSNVRLLTLTAEQADIVEQVSDFKQGDGADEVESDTDPDEEMPEAEAAVVPMPPMSPEQEAEAKANIQSLGYPTWTKADFLRPPNQEP